MIVKDKVVLVKDIKEAAPNVIDTAVSRRILNLSSDYFNGRSLFIACASLYSESHSNAWLSSSNRRSAFGLVEASLQLDKNNGPETNEPRAARIDVSSLQDRRAGEFAAAGTPTNVALSSIPICRLRDQFSDVSSPSTPVSCEDLLQPVCTHFGTKKPQLLLQSSGSKRQIESITDTPTYNSFLNTQNELASAQRLLATLARADSEV